MVYFLIFFRVACLALGQSHDCPSASEATLKDMGNFSQHLTTTKHKQSMNYVHNFEEVVHVTGNDTRLELPAVSPPAWFNVDFIQGSLCFEWGHYRNSFSLTYIPLFLCGWNYSTTCTLYYQNQKLVEVIFFFSLTHWGLATHTHTHIYIYTSLELSHQCF